jgi:hypothetical protein
MKSSGMYIRVICLIGKDVEESGRGLIFIYFLALFGENEKYAKSIQASQNLALCNPLFVRYC